MKPLGLSASIFIKKPKHNQREKFLEEMDPVAPWLR